MTVRLLSRVLRWARRRRVSIYAGAALLALASVPLLQQLTFDSNVLNLLPRKGPAVSSFRTYLEHFGNLDRLYVLIEAPQDSFMSDHAEFVASFVRQLRALPEIESVDTGAVEEGEDWEYILDNELLLFGPERMPDLFARFEPEAMARELVNARDLLSVPSADVTALVRQDPLGLLSLIRDHLAAEVSILDVDPSQEGFFTSDGRSQLVIARPIRPPYDTAFSRELLQRLEAIESSVRSSFGSDSPSASETPTLEVVGAYRSSLETENLIRTEGTVTALGSLAGVLAIIFLVFRSLRVLACSAIPLLLGATMTAALSGIFYQLSTAASGSAAMLFGVSVDGVLLLYFRYLEERRRGATSDGATGLLAPTVISVGLGFTTTAATYFGLVAIDFPSLEEVGRLIGVGILLSGLFTVLLVPGLLPETPPDVRLPTTEWLGPFVVQFRGYIVWTAVIVTLGLGVAAVGLTVVPDLERLQPQTDAARAEEALLERFSIPDEVVLMLTQGPNLDPLLEANHTIGEHIKRSVPDVVATFPHAFVPSVARQDAVRGAIRAYETSPQEVSERLADAAAESGFRADAFDPFVARLPRLLDAEQYVTHRGYLEHGLSDLVDRYISETDDGYVTVAYAYPSTPMELETIRLVIEQSGQLVETTGVSLVNRELAQTFPSKFITGGLIGTLGVFVVALIGFGSLRLTVLSLVPTALGLVWGAGVLSLMDVELDLFSIFALLMCVGIGVDYSIHVLHRYSLDTALGVARPLVAVAPAVLVACATTLVGFGSLMLSGYGPLRSLGAVSVVTLTACVLTSLFVLPAYLSIVDESDHGTAGEREEDG